MRPHDLRMPATLRRICVRLDSLIEKKISAVQLIEAIRQRRQRGFFAVYTATKLMRGGRLDDARRILEAQRDDVFSQQFLKFASRQTGAGSRKSLFQSVLPLHYWENVSENRRFNENALKFLARGAAGKTLDEFTVVDFGTGDGSFLESFLRLVRKLGTTNTRVVVVEPSASLMAEARTRVRKYFPKRGQALFLRKRAENLSRRDWFRIAEMQPSLAFSSAALHHLSPSAKVSFFSAIRGLGCEFYLFELEGAEESVDGSSMFHIYSVHRFYSGLLRALWRTSISTKKKEACAREFILAEAYYAMFAPFDLRQNYHASAEQWLRYAKAGGMKRKLAIRKSISPDYPQQLMMSWR